MDSGSPQVPPRSAGHVTHSDVSFVGKLLFILHLYCRLVRISQQCFDNLVGWAQSTICMCLGCAWYNGSLLIIRCLKYRPYLFVCA